jgi:hypothetical protein
MTNAKSQKRSDIPSSWDGQPLLSFFRGLKRCFLANVVSKGTL